MSYLTRSAIVAALLLGGLVFSSAANAQTNQTKAPKKAASATVSGRITSHGKGRAGIAVGLRNPPTGPQATPLYKAVTDAEGNYRIINVPPGRYLVAPLAPSYVVAELNTFAFRGKSLILNEGESVEGIDFSIERGAVITGKVTHADGRPLIEERIQIAHADRVDERTPISYAEMTFQTDDRGIYRAYGMPPGRYKVSIGTDEDSFFGSFNRGRPTYPRTFHPDTSDSNEARVIELTEGTEATNIDITVRQTVKGFVATGLAVEAETNKPVPNVQFALQKVAGERDAPVMGMAVTSDRLGNFRLENLAPGKYVIYIMPVDNSELRSEGTRFEVIDQDISGLVIRATKGASVSGTIVLEGSQDKAVLARLAQMRIVGFVTGSDAATSGYAQTSPIGPDGSFRVAGLSPGTLYLNLSEHNRTMQTNFTIIRTERDSVAQGRGVEIKAGEQITGLRVVVVYGNGKVRGVLKIENGPAPTGTRFMVRLLKPGERTSVGRAQEVDARGHFIIEGVPAGVYDLHLSAFLPQSRPQLPTAQQSVTVGEGGTTDVEISLDLSKSASPTP